MYMDACEGQKRGSESLELSLHVVVSHLAWMLRTKLQSSARAVRTLSL